MINSLLNGNSAIVLVNDIDFVHVSLDPIDAMKSFVKDFVTDTSRKGAFTFRVELRDRFSNSIRITDKDNKKRAKISVQYSSYIFSDLVPCKILTLYCSS